MKALKSHLLWAVILMSAASTARAETLVQQREASANHILALKKVTVGPEDQYQSTLSSDHKHLVFTHKEDLIARLKEQDVESGDVKDLLPLTADSSEPVYGPGDELAFVYYRFNARGDICYFKPDSDQARPVNENRIKCLLRDTATASVERLNPFWVNDHEIGYLERDPRAGEGQGAKGLRTGESRVIAQDIGSGARRVLASGRLWSPNMAVGGHYLVYNELQGDGTTRGLVVKDLASGKTRNLNFRVPGMTGFPQIDPHETHIYFSHYLNDTNDDRVIDGSDNAVVFRVPLASVWSSREGDEILPEQLTSVETSCSFPKPTADALFVTCGFEGSLDIYQVPLTGVVPSGWTADLLQNAIRSSRSYQDRILLLNALEVRTNSAPATIEPMLLTNHILADDTVAARYYLDRIERAQKGPDAHFSDLLRIYLQARERKKDQVSGEISREFASEMMKFDRLAEAVKDQPRMQSLVRGFLQSFLNRTSAAQAHYKRVDEKSATNPIEKHLWFELANRIYSMERAADRPVLLSMYHNMMSATEFNEQEHIFYATAMLKAIQAGEPSLEKRIQLISSVRAGLPPRLPNDVSLLLDSEMLTLKIISAKDDATKLKIYRDLDKLIIQSKTDYFLRRALYVRAILSFNEAAEFKYLGFIAENWLRYTPADDTELSYAREVVAEAAFDRAYEVFDKGAFAAAEGYFFGAVTYTDNPEAHSGYIKTMFAENDRKSLDRTYQNMQTRHIVEDNIKFAQALILILDAETKEREAQAKAGAAAQPETSTAAYDQAIAKLMQMTTDRESAPRYLLLGYSYLRQVLRQSSGLDFPNQAFENAHRNLMLAYDLGRDHDRIRASALLDLGILHMRARNFGLAAHFLALRKNLGFVTPQDRQAFSWLYAEALFHNHQSLQAADELAELDAKLVTPQILERLAFYSLAAERNQQAVGYYTQYFKAAPGPLDRDAARSDFNLAKIKLSYGYALMKVAALSKTAAKATADSQRILREAIAHADHLSTLKAEKGRILEFDPLHIKLLAYGFLAQQGSAQDRLAALQARLALLEAHPKLVDNAQLTRAQALAQAASLRVQIGDHAQAAEELKSSLELVAEYGKKNEYLSVGIFHAAADFMTHAVQHPELYHDASEKTLHDVVEATLKAYDDQKSRLPILDLQKLELQMLTRAYNARLHGAGMHAGMGDLLNSPEAQALKTAAPPLWAKAQALGAAL